MGSKFGGICTGAYAKLARLNNRTSKFTLHWENQPGFIETFRSYYQHKVFSKLKKT